ncbi:MAG: HAD family hydrolase [Bdellovibrionaceae bacterium]|nr:HAD family hydrolase [Pseudobdellovibrionaceae bacterium]
MSQALDSILAEIRSTCTAGGSHLTHRPLLVFDLDSTLFDLTLRVTAILEHFAASAENRARFPELCEKLMQAEIRRSDWGLREPLARLGLHEHEHREFFESVHAHWARGFFSNDYLDRDFPLPGAVDFVKNGIEAGADVLYLTGRDTARMQAGTIKSLEAHGFPNDGVRARLGLKPDLRLDDAEFKAEVIADLANNHRPIWLFENEPVNINAVLRRTPQVGIVFIDTCHSGLEEVKTALAKIPHFEISRRELDT